MRLGRPLATRNPAGGCPLLLLGNHAAGETTMVDENRVTGALDKAKGAVKEGLGTLTGDEKLKAEGTADKAKGHVESAVGGAKDTVRDAVRKD